MLKIALIPIDNRPVCYCMPEQICNFSKDIELLLPPRNLLGGLTTYAKSEDILNWLNSLEKIDMLVISLDTIAYGGLVASRRTTEDINNIKNRLQKLKEIIINKKIKTYACSSIMRISNNNINEEEKPYWNLWGKKIFDYSYNLHKSQKKYSYDANAKFSCIRQIIPTEILDDYFETRKRNFEINKLYLNWQQEGIFDYLVFSKDDCAEFGINVFEAEELTKTIKEKNLNAIVKTGADEIPLSLLARAFSTNKKIKIFAKYTRPEEIHLISKYEDVSVQSSIKGQVELCGCELTNDEENCDLILFVNNFKSEQGELVMNISTKPYKNEITLPQKPYILADIVFANGADNDFIKALFKHQLTTDNFLGYAGWNTTANTVGSALCAGIIKYLSSNIDKKLFLQQQFTRFADDWAYQANCREQIKSEESLENKEERIKELMHPFIFEIQKKLDTKIDDVKYSFPWNRFFEIEIKLSSNY